MKQKKSLGSISNATHTSTDIVVNESDAVNKIDRKEMSNRVPSRIENLPNEIWLEVFHHLDWINVFSAFYGINKRINQLLMCINTLSLYSSCLINYSNSIYVYFQVNLI